MTTYECIHGSAANGRVVGWQEKLDVVIERWTVEISKVRAAKGQAEHIAAQVFPAYDSGPATLEFMTDTLKNMTRTGIRRAAMK
ncbi:hypothetical protein GCM10009425_20570 [Pseudomonas asuensis]|uniref:Uncharacterized protein n=1 Tax=Pseudomonas asuensis TaxID=1825787 RepID=A0ABQ2GS41_9PSED|nr:hypothetical protein GCM10009425_20570 [Pseudomonas asuensis]